MRASSKTESTRRVTQGKPRARTHIRPATSSEKPARPRTGGRSARVQAAVLAATIDELEEHGYDERFRRLWRLYLCYCEAGFAEHRIGLAQALYAKPNWRPAAPARFPLLVSSSA